MSYQPCGTDFHMRKRFRVRRPQSLQTTHIQNRQQTIRIFASFYQSFDLRWFDQYIEQQLTYKVAIMMENVRLLSDMCRSRLFSLSKRSRSYLRPFVLALGLVRKNNTVLVLVLSQFQFFRSLLSERSKFTFANN